MKFYAIDFGHTNYKIGLIKDNNVISKFKSGYHEHSIIDELNSKSEYSEFGKILCSSVIDENIINSILNQLPSDIKNLIKFIKTEDCQKFLSVAYKKNSHRLGVDRALNLIAASKKCDRDLIVIDAGTAITIDYLDSNKKHLGGIILPSKEIIDRIFLEMLSFNFLEEEVQETIFSQNTRSCIENGSRISAYNSINYIIDKMSSKSKTSPVIFITGGNAQNIIENCNHSLIHVESLLFEGLACVESD